MRTFFEKGIAFAVTIISLLLCSVWYFKSGEIEPLIGVIGSVGALLTIIVYRVFPEKKEPPIPVQSNKEYNTVKDSELNADQNLIVGNKNKVVQYITYEADHKIPRHLTPPPFIPETFLGRETELQAHLR